MSQTRASVERQMQHAQDALSAWVRVLDEKGVDVAARRRDPVWRNLNSKRRELAARIRSVAGVEALNEDLKRRKEERLSGSQAEIAEKPKKKQQQPKQKKKNKKK